MRLHKKWMAWLLTALILTVSATGAFAEQSAVSEGSEVTTSIRATWHSLPTLGAEVNDVLKPLFDSMEITNRSGEIDSTLYTDMDVKFSGQSALSFQLVKDESGTYVISPMLPEPVVFVDGDEVALQANLMTWANETFDMPSELDDMVGGDITAIKQPDMAALENAIAQIDTTELEAAMTEWTAKAITGEPVTEDITSILGVEAMDATVYTISKQELVELIEIIRPFIKENDAYWTEYIKFVNSMLPVEEQMTVEEVYATLDEFDPAAIPEDIVLYYAECHDATGAVSANMVHAIVPKTETEPGVEGYIEWLPDGSSFYAHALSEGDGIAFAYQLPQAETSTVDGAEVVKTSFACALNVYEDNTETMVINMNIDNSSTTKGDEQVTTNDIRFLVTSGSDTSGFQIAPTTTKKTDETGETINAVVDINLLANDETLPMLTLYIDAVKGAPSGLPFDPASVEFFRPGTLTEAEFIEWMNSKVMMSVMQAGFGVLALLPEEVMATIIPPEMITQP